MRLKIFLSVILILHFVGLSVSQTTNTNLILLQNGEKYLSEGKVDTAITELTKILQDCSDVSYCIRAQNRIARIYMDYKKDYQKAIESFNKVYDNYVQVVDKTNTMLVNQIIEALFQSGYIERWYLKNNSKAREYFSKIIEQYPESYKCAEAQYNIAWCYRTENKYKEAAKAFKKVVMNYPQSTYVPRSLYEAGICYSKIEKYKEAKEICKS